MQTSENVLLLSHNQWNVSIMAEFHQHPQETFTKLVHDLSASRDAISRALKYLTNCSWIDRSSQIKNQYVLTRRGRKIAPISAAIKNLSLRLALEPLIKKRWTLPVMTALQGWELRHMELKAMLPHITPRALTLALKDMHEAGLIEREVIGGFPPTTVYRLSSSGRKFLSPLKKL